MLSVSASGYRVGIGVEVAAGERLWSSFTVTWLEKVVGEDEARCCLCVQESRLDLVHPLTSPSPLCTHSCRAEYLRTLPSVGGLVCHLCVCVRTLEMWLVVKRAEE